MKRAHVLAAAYALAAAPASAQTADAPATVSAPGLGEVVVTANRQNTRYAQQDRPVVGLRRQADAAVMPVAIASDTREEAARKKEIHAVLLAALDRAQAAGVELVSGAVQLAPVTRANYQELPFQWAGRADTSKVDLMVRVRLAGSAAQAEKKLTDFIASLSGAGGAGRATVDKTGGLTLTIVDPDQYRDAIVRLVAEDARRSAATFGPDFSTTISGIDGQVGWSQVGSTEVFLFIPYRYTVVPK
jgi:hypothetical protein